MQKILVRNWDDAKRVVVQVGWWGHDATQRNLIGTGVIVGDKHVLTARHVVDAVPHGQQPGVVVVNRSYLPTTWAARIRPVVRVKTYAASDLTLLELGGEPLTDGATFGYDLAAATATDSVPVPGAVVDGYGCPATQMVSATSTNLVLLSGLLHSRRHVLLADQHKLVVSYPNPHGFSGGPLFNEEGALIGIASLSMTDDSVKVAGNVYAAGRSQYEGIDHILPLA